jgi:hypothetical protein
MKSDFQGIDYHGYELDLTACTVAKSGINPLGQNRLKAITAHVRCQNSRCSGFEMRSDDRCAPFAVHRQEQLFIMREGRRP